jgi:hypothetical protein
MTADTYTMDNRENIRTALSEFLANTANNLTDVHKALLLNHPACKELGEVNAILASRTPSSSLRRRTSAPDHSYSSEFIFKVCEGLLGAYQKNLRIHAEIEFEKPLNLEVVPVYYRSMSLMHLICITAPAHIINSLLSKEKSKELSQFKAQVDDPRFHNLDIGDGDCAQQSIAFLLLAIGKLNKDIGLDVTSVSRNGSVAPMIKFEPQTSPSKISDVCPSYCSLLAKDFGESKENIYKLLDEACQSSRMLFNLDATNDKVRSKLGYIMSATAITCYYGDDIKQALYMSEVIQKLSTAKSDQDFDWKNFKRMNLWLPLLVACQQKQQACAKNMINAIRKYDKTPRDKFTLDIIDQCSEELPALKQSLIQLKPKKTPQSGVFNYISTVFSSPRKAISNSDDPSSKELKSLI